ncbi:MAG: hypothetical protein E7514_07125 [Ruminococcaceae bacterium]|nr:hypothetical protein [Oscillospiraceae bacterium]
MTALYIILGIIAFFILLLSIKFRIEAEYIDEFTLKVRWLFIKFTIYPLKKPIELGGKQKKPAETKEEKPKDENISKKKPNPFKTFYENQGFDGVLQLINDSADALADMMKSFKKHFIIDDLYLWLVISKNHDAAATAIEYGNVCQKVFPALGYICSTLKVRRYDVSVEPDFIGTLSTGQFVFNCSLRPIFLINAGIAFAFKMLFKVLLKILSAKPKNAESENTNNSQNIKGGAVQ